VDVLPGLVILLPAADHQLIFLNRHIKLIAGKTSDRQSDSQAFGLADVAVTALDIVRRITVGALDHAVERTLDLVESKQERT
jgi:hypothetical protein